MNKFVKAFVFGSTILAIPIYTQTSVAQNVVIQSPADILSAFPNGGLQMQTTIQDLLNVDASLLSEILTLVSSATPSQLSAIGQGLASSNIALSSDFSELLGQIIAANPVLANSVTALANTITNVNVVEQMGSGLHKATVALQNAPNGQSGIDIIQNAAALNSTIQTAFNAADAVESTSATSGTSGTGSGVRTAAASTTTTGGGAANNPSPN